MKTNFSIILFFFVQKKIIFIQMSRNSLKIKIAANTEILTYFKNSIQEKKFIINLQNTILQNENSIFFFWNRKLLFIKKKNTKNIFFSIQGALSILENKNNATFIKKIFKKNDDKFLLNHIKKVRVLKEKIISLQKKIYEYFFFELKFFINLNALSTKIFFNCIEKYSVFNNKNKVLQAVSLFSYKTQNYLQEKKKENKSFLFDINSQYAKSLSEKIPILIKNQIKETTSFWTKKFLLLTFIDYKKNKIIFTLGNYGEKNLNIKNLNIKKKSIFNNFIINLFSLKQFFYKKNIQHLTKFLFVNLYGYLGLKSLSSSKSYKIKENLLVASYIVAKSKNNFNKVTNNLNKNLFYYDTDMFFSTKIVPYTFINFKIGKLKLIKLKTLNFSFIQNFRNYILMHKQMCKYLIKSLTKKNPKENYNYLLSWKYKNHKEINDRITLFKKNNIWNYKLLYKTESSLIR